MASWKTTIIKESFSNKDPEPPSGTIIHKPIIEPLAEFDNITESLGKNADELLIMQNIRDIPKKITPPEEPTPTLSDQIKGLADQPDLYKGAKLAKDTINNLPTAFNNAVDNMAINGFVDNLIPDTKSEESKSSKHIIRGQFIRYLALAFSYIIILNWWFLWYYSDFTFNWKRILEIPIFHIFYYAIEPVCTIFEAINYYILNMRMDADLSPDIREAMHKLWDWRPITFTLFYFAASSFLLTSPVGQWIASILSGSPTGLTFSIMLFSIITYFYLNLNSGRLMQLQLQFGNVLVVIFVLLLMLLFVILFSGILTPFFALYLMILSNFSIMLFNGRNMFAKISEMFNDLEDAPVEEPDSKSTFTRLNNFAFRKFHSIAFVLFLLLPCLIYNIREATGKLKNADLIAGVVVINVVLVLAYSYLYSYHTAVIELFKILWDAVKEWFSPTQNLDIPGEINEAPVKLV